MAQQVGVCVSTYICYFIRRKVGFLSHFSSWREKKPLREQLRVRVRRISLTYPSSGFMIDGGEIGILQFITYASVRIDHSDSLVLELTL